MTSLALDPIYHSTVMPTFVAMQVHGLAKPKYGQRNYMCSLFAKHAGNKLKVCAEFAQADHAGLIEHKSNLNKVKKEKYALALWYDGAKKGWLR